MRLSNRFMAGLPLQEPTWPNLTIKKKFWRDPPTLIQNSVNSNGDLLDLTRSLLDLVRSHQVFHVLSLSSPFLHHCWSWLNHPLPMKRPNCPIWCSSQVNDELISMHLIKSSQALVEYKPNPYWPVNTSTDLLTPLSKTLYLKCCYGYYKFYSIKLTNWCDTN